MAKRDPMIMRPVSALLRFGLMARASLGGNDSSFSSMSGWSCGTIIVPEDLRDPKRGRDVRGLGAATVSSPSEVWVEVWFESVVVVEGSAMEGTGALDLVVDSEVEGVGASAEDMVDDWVSSRGCLCTCLKEGIAAAAQWGKLLGGRVVEQCA